MESGYLFPTTIALALLIYLIYSYILHPAFLSPLSKIPSAHPLAPLTSRWFQHRINNSAELKTLYAAHTTHGEIVRLGPNEVSVVSLEGLRKLYVEGLDKNSWWQSSGLFCWFGHHNMVSTLDHASHAKVKRVVAPEYTKSSLQRSEEMKALSERILMHRFLPRLSRAAENKEDVDVMALFERVAIDFASDHLFGLECGSDFLLEDSKSGDEWTSEWAALRKDDEGAKRTFTETFTLDMCKAAVAENNSSTLAKKLYAHFAAESKARDMPDDDDDAIRRCGSEMIDHIIATQENVTIAWTYLAHHLCQHPELETELRAELRNLHPTIPLHPSGEGTTPLPSPSDLDALPILNAVVCETVRLHSGNPARMPRVSPAGGMMLHGFFIPPGTVLSSNQFCVHRNPEAFPYPLEWRPERFLGKLEGVEGWRKWYWPFGSGPRVCVGQHFAVQVMKLVAAAIYTHFTTSIVKDDGIEQTDAWLSGPTSREILFRFHSVESDGEA